MCFYGDNCYLCRKNQSTVVVEDPSVAIDLSDKMYSDVHESSVLVSKGLAEDVYPDVITNGAVPEDVNSEDAKQSSNSEDPKSSQKLIRKNLLEERSYGSGNESTNSSRSDLSQDVTLNLTKSRETVL